MVPDGHDADFLRKTILDHYNMSLGTGLAKVAGKIFRIGHLGDFNELMLAGTLAGVEMGLMKSNIPSSVLSGRQIKEVCQVKKFSDIFFILK